MADNVLGVLFQDIANAIRAKTGGTDTMKPNEFPTQIANIPAGGGSSADVRYVTFIGADGAVLYKKAVAVGDDCVDVAAKGLISTPTKESTVAETYTYSGWALTEGGAASADALKNVTEDRTVYAAFTASARKYTARFLDGDTVMQASQVAYGTQATPPNTEKDGYAFVAWTPSNLTIYEDTDFVGTWEVDQGWLVQKEFPYDKITTYATLTEYIHAKYTPNGSKYIVAHGKKLYLFDATTQPYTLLASYSLDYNVNCMAINPAGTLLLVGLDYSTGEDKYNVFVYLINNSSLLKRDVLTGKRNTAASPQGFAFSPDGTTVWIAFYSSTMQRYTISDWSVTSIEITYGSNQYPQGIAVSPDGTMMAVAVTGNFVKQNLKFFDLTNDNTDVTSTYIGTSATATGQRVAYSPDGRYLAMGCKKTNNFNSTLYVYDTSTTPYTKIEVSCALNVSDVSFSTDGTLLVAASGIAPKIFEVGTWTAKDAPMVLPGGSAGSCDFNNDTTRLAVAHLNSPYVTLYEVKR